MTIIERAAGDVAAHTISLTKDELNTLWRNTGDLTVTLDGVMVTLTTSLTRDSFRSAKEQ